MPPTTIQFFAPLRPVPSTRVAPSRQMAAAAMSQRIFFTRSRSRIKTPSTTKRASPSRMAANCLNSPPGFLEAVTARERVHRKKAMVSISKPTRPMARMNMK